MPQSNSYGIGFTLEQVEAIFSWGLNMYVPQLAEMVEEVTMGDGEGVEKLYAVTDPILPPEELMGDVPPKMAQMGSRAFTIAPREYGMGISISYRTKRDSRVDAIAWALSQMGMRFAYWPMREMLRLVFGPNNWLAGSGMFLGPDNQRIFSTTHTYATSKRKPGVPAPTRNAGNLSNVTTGSGNGGGVKLYTSTDQVQTDFHAMRAAILSRKDAHGEPVIIEQPGGVWHAYVNTVAPSTYRYLNLAFTLGANPGDNTNRETQQYGVKVHQDPFLNGIGSDISTSEHADWILYYQMPGARPPLMRVKRQALEHASQDWPTKRYEEHIWTQDDGVGWTSWEPLQLCNAN